ncbi:MAG TPA: enoyl-CoA hydratase-related protein [Haliangiales bacterium]|nr:enoyl-CoA hydratase-related protein [Haliangiales bacterium]
MTYENITVERDGGVATLAINRPKALNALNSRTIGELLAAVGELADARVVVVTGAGEKAFVAGADIAEMAAMSRDEAFRFGEAGHRLMNAIEASERPWIAAVNGFALGGGCELALACDFIYATPNASLGQPEILLGVVPGFGGTQRLLRRVGIAKAKELIYTGERIGAEEALRIGLVDAILPMVDIRARAAKLAEKPPLALAAAKGVIQRGQSLPLDEALRLEAEAFATLFDSADQREGMQAFLAKRPARFEGK